MFNKKIFCIALIFAAFNFSIFADESDEEEELDIAPQRDVVIFVGPHDYNLDPHTASYANEAQVLTGLYEGLFSYHPVNLEPVKALCESYKISRDKLRWTFKLTDATFSDGSPITAQTVKDSWLGLLATPDAPFASFLDCVKNAREFRTGKVKKEKVGIEVRDEKSLVVYLNEPVSHLPNLLCHHSLSAVSPKKNVYSGAFTLEKFDDKNIILKKNERYREAKKVLVPRIIFSFTNDTEENTYQFNLGKVDWIDSYAISDKIIDTDCIHVTANFGTTYLFFKNEHEPWSNPKIRQALLTAIPYDELRKDYYLKADTLIYPLSGYPKVTGLSDYDEQDALSMMNQARDELGIPRNKKLVLVFAIAEADFFNKWADVLTKAWSPLGVEVLVQKTTFNRYNPSISSWDADLFFYSWLGDYADPLAFLELFRTGSSFNESKWSNSEFDSLLTQANLAESFSERLKILSKAEQILLDDGEIIPINYSLSLHVVSKELGGWSQNTLDLHPLRYLFIKKTEPASIKNGTLIRSIK